MARVPEIIRRKAISQVAAKAPRAGQGFAALAELASLGSDFVEPAAKKEAQETGFDATYRDADGTLRVAERNVLGGEMSDIHNAAAFSKYLSQRSIDMSESFTEMSQKYEFDPDGFKKASDGYISLLEADENIPRLLKEDLLANAKTEANRRFNGLYNTATERTYRESDRNTSTHRDMLVDDYVNLYSGGDIEAAESKLTEIEQLSAFRANAPYISETKAETEAYLRGARGTAKAARLVRVLTDTKGATELSDDIRQEIDDTLKDPDLSPAARQKLYSATQGRLKGVDAAAFVNNIVADDYASKVVRAESKGNTSAKNPNSTATGPHQFIRSTWMENVKELRAQGEAVWATGMRDDQILAMRTDMEASSEVQAHFRSKNAELLNGAGIPVNDTTEYMAHFFGAGGAVQVLTADPSALLSDILPADVIAANPFLKNMTPVDAKNWAARKMTVKSSDIAMQQTAVDQIEDPEVRAMASARLSDLFNVRKRLEDAAAVEYEQRLSAKDDSLTEQEIMQDHSISDQNQKTLVSTLRKQRKDQISVQQTILELANDETSWNPYDSKQRNRVNDAYVSVLDGEGAMSPAGQVAAGEIAMRTGFLPKNMFDAMRGVVVGDDPEILASSMELLSQILQRQPGAVDMHGGKEAVNGALSDYRFYSQFMGAVPAAERMIKNNSPESVAKRKNLSDAAKTAAKDLKPGDVISHLSARGVSAELGNPAQEAEMMTEFDKLFRDAYVSTGEVGLAKNRALDEMSRIYGPNEITGNSRLMKFPPQNFYPSSIENPDYLTDQITQSVNEYVFGDEADWVTSYIPSAVLFNNQKWIPSDDIIILSDQTTREEVAAGQAPSYNVMFMGPEGEIQAVPGRFFFDPPSSNPDANKAEFDRQRDRVQQDIKLQEQYDKVNRGEFKPGSFFEE
jgi:hypothetical protein